MARIPKYSIKGPRDDSQPSHFGIFGPFLAGADADADADADA